VLAGLVLCAQFAKRALQGLQFLAAAGLLVLLTLDAAGSLQLFGLFVALLVELGHALSHLLVEGHKAGRGVIAQGREGGRGQEAGKRGEFVLKALAVGIQMGLLLAQLLAGKRAGFGAALHLLLQVGRFLLQGQQRVLALLVLGNAVLQLAQAQGQPRLALVRRLGQPLWVQRVGFKARGQGLLLLMDTLLLLQKLFLLGNQAADFFPQLGQGFLEPVDHCAGIGLFLFIVTAEAVQQGFGLMIGVLGTAAHRAGLVILQLPAQFFDAGTAGQALALQQLAGDLQGLLGLLKIGLGLNALLAQALAFLLHAVLLGLQLLQARIEGLLAAAQTL